MVRYRFYRLAHRAAPPSGRGRRRYRLVSYPKDTGEFRSRQSAIAWGRLRRYAAVLCGEEWMLLSARAATCVYLHRRGRAGYVVTF